MSGYTPGPWSIHVESWGAVDVRGADGRPVAEMWWTSANPDKQRDEVRANARLIAAAPDLAAALQALIPLAEEGIRAWAPLALEDELEAAHTLVEQARAALAKVEG